MSNDTKILLAILLAAGIAYGSYCIGCRNSCKCGESQQSQQQGSNHGLKPIKVP